MSLVRSSGVSWLALDLMFVVDMGVFQEVHDGFIVGSDALVDGADFATGSLDEIGGNEEWDQEQGWCKTVVVHQGG